MATAFQTARAAKAMLAPAAPGTPADMPTAEQLALAYRHHADHHWPATLEEALRRPAYRAVILQLARRINRPAWQARTGRQHGLPSAPVPATPADPSARPSAAPPRSPYSQATGLPTPLAHWPKAKTMGPGWVDHKRAAANDKDDT